MTKRPSEPHTAPADGAASPHTKAQQTDRAAAEAERERLDKKLDAALDMSFPASDPIAL